MRDGRPLRHFTIAASSSHYNRGHLHRTDPCDCGRCVAGLYEAWRSGVGQCAAGRVTTKRHPSGVDSSFSVPLCCIGVFGAAGTDDSFGGGGDRVRYRIRLPAGRHTARIDVELRYQPIASRWAHSLDGYTSAETSKFLSFFRAIESNTPTVVATASGN